MSNFKIFTNKAIDEQCLLQIEQMSKIYNEEKIRIMPDYHAGKGCVIGTTIQLKDKVTPNLVGVDIGCGVTSYIFNKKEIDFYELDEKIRYYIPSGKSVRSKPYFIIKTQELLYKLKAKLDESIIDRAMLSIGTLGGGNHFIEIGESDTETMITVHSGSRNIGVAVCKYYQNIAINNMKSKKNEDIKKIVLTTEKHKIQEEIDKINNKYDNIPKELSYLSGQDMEDYINDLNILQEYALLNRITILDIVAKMIDLDIYEYRKINAINSTHNYVDENNILRKGAISAKDGERVIIPLNMRDGIILGIGKGNEEWNYSAPHGAGRIYGRSEAKKTLTLDEFQKSMNGIFTSCVSNETLDESPMAYKSMQEIISVISDSVDIKKIIKPIYNFKANE